MPFLEKAPEPKLGGVVANMVTFSRDELLNAPIEIEVMVEGMIIDVNAVLSKAYSLIHVTPSGIFMLLSDVHCENAKRPIFVTPFGIVTIVRVGVV